jgi:hypothetical protein
LEWRVLFSFVLALGQTPWSELHFVVVAFYLQSEAVRNKNNKNERISGDKHPIHWSLSGLSEIKSQLWVHFVSNFAENNLI